MSLRACEFAGSCAAVQATRELLFRRLRGFDLRGLTDADLAGLAAGDAATVERIRQDQRVRTPAEARRLMAELFGDAVAVPEPSS